MLCKHLHKIERLDKLASLPRKPGGRNAQFCVCASLVWTRLNRSVHVPRLFRTCMFMESMCAYSPYLVGWLRNFTLKRGTLARGRGWLGAQHSWASCSLCSQFYSLSSETLEICSWRVYLHITCIKKTKKILKSLFDGRLGPLKWVLRIKYNSKKYKEVNIIFER